MIVLESYLVKAIDMVLITILSNYYGKTIGRLLD